MWNSEEQNIAPYIVLLPTLSFYMTPLISKALMDITHLTACVYD